MKTTTILLAAMLLLSGNAFAQLQSGTKFAGLQAGAGFSKSGTDGKTTSFQLAPIAGYFLSDNLMVGLSGEYSRSVYEQNQQPGYSSMLFTSNSNTTSYSAGPVARCYLPVGGKVAFFAEALAGYTVKKTKSEYMTMEHYNGHSYQSTEKTKEQYLYGSLGPGMVFFPVPKVGIELKMRMLSYIHNGASGSDIRTAFSLSKTMLGAGFYF